MTEPNKLPDPWSSEKTALDYLLSFLRGLSPEALDISAAKAERTGNQQMLERLNPLFAQALQDRAAALPDGLSAADGFLYGVCAITSVVFVGPVIASEAQELNENDRLTVRSIMGDSLT